MIINIEAVSPENYARLAQAIWSINCGKYSPIIEGILSGTYPVRPVAEIMEATLSETKPPELTVKIRLDEEMCQGKEEGLTPRQCLNDILMALNIFPEV